MKKSHALEHESNHKHVQAARALNHSTSIPEPNYSFSAPSTSAPAPPSPRRGFGSKTSLSNSLFEPSSFLAGPACAEDPLDGIYDDFSGPLSTDFGLPPEEDSAELEPSVKARTYDYLPAMMSSTSMVAHPGAPNPKLVHPDIQVADDVDQGKHLPASKLLYAYACLDPFEDIPLLEDPVGWFPYNRVQVCGSYFCIEER
jgi:hypothetical protein